MFSKQEQLSKVREPKPKYRRKCKNCKTWYRTDRNGQVVCDDIDCAILYGKKQNEKQQRQAKVQFNGNDKSKVTAKLQQTFNTYIRIRDAKDKCISCDYEWSGEGGRVKHASHFISVQKSKVLRFDENNVHKSCQQCNDFLRGNLIEYRIRLIKKIGIEEVERLEDYRMLPPAKYSIDYLKENIKKYKHKINKLKEL